MENKLLEKITTSLVGQIQKSEGLKVFAEGDNQFEQWMQVAMCAALIEGGIEYKKIRVETNVKVSYKNFSPDICFQNSEKKCAIELKVVIAEGGGARAALGKVVDDITKLEEYRKANVAEIGIILFVVYPLNNGVTMEAWANEKGAAIRNAAYGEIINLAPQAFESKKFTFANGKDGYIYCGVLK